MEAIYPKARDMMAKPRYWHVAYPLAVTSLCVAPQEFFLRNWVACFEAGLGKLKVNTMNAPMKTISHGDITGEDLSSPRLKWYDATTVDIFISLPRTSIYILRQARHHIQADFSLEPPRGYRTRGTPPAIHLHRSFCPIASFRRRERALP